MNVESKNKQTNQPKQKKRKNENGWNGRDDINSQEQFLHETKRSLRILAGKGAMLCESDAIEHLWISKSAFFS